jgi:hypothetical protein
MEKIDLTITTINYNVSNDLQKCISSFLETYQNLDFTYEWYIFDNNSNAKEKAKFDELIKKYWNYAELKFIKKKYNLGHAVLNSVLNEARGRYWLFLDPDTWQMGKPIPKLIEFMDSHPSVGIASALQYKPNGKPLLYYGSKFNVFMAFFIGTILGETIDQLIFFSKIRKIFYPFERKNVTYRKTTEIGHVPFACTIERMELLKKDGYVIDYDFRFMFNDIDLCKRARDKNYKVVILPSAKIVHVKGTAQNKKNLYWRRMTFIKALIKYFRKHYKYLVWLYKFLLIFDIIFLILKKNTGLGDCYYFKTYNEVLYKNKQVRAKKWKQIFLFQLYQLLN